MKAIKMIGRRFGRLFVVGEAEQRVQPNGKRIRHFICKCDCGSPEKSVNGWSLRGGLVQGCGCVNREATSKRNRTHGESAKPPTPEYRAWQNMINRCENSNDPKFAYYGARGINVCSADGGKAMRHS
jgi:hypothetical protein